MVATCGLLVFAGASRADDATVMRNLKYYCANLNGPGSSPYDKVFLRCDVVQGDPDVFQMVLADEIPLICQSIQDQCRAANTDARKSLLSGYLTTLSCAPRGYTCLSGSGSQANICNQGDINIVVRVIDQIRQAGGVVPRALQSAVRAYAEACALNRATQTALANVNTELRAFYANKYLGCMEAAHETTTTNECTAAIDRQWQLNSVQAMFNWTNSHSIVSQVTLDAVRRWTGLD
jgi:hypothetical protein